MAIKTIICSDKDLLILKVLVAKELNAKGYSQTLISRLLDITQPMVSNYLKTKPVVSDSIMKYAQSVIKMITDGHTPHYNICITPSNMGGRYYLGSREELLTDERQEVIDNILRALNKLKTMNLSGLIPKIKVNLAMSLRTPKKTSDIASIAGGIVFINNVVSFYGPVGFENSRNLASLILKMKTHGNKYRSIMNIRYNSYKTSLKTLNYNGGKIPKGTDILLHKGAFGIEPCAYILGNDAVDVVHKLSCLA
jgi:XRE family transcriptional regulator, thiamine biosynthesis regulator